MAEEAGGEAHHGRDRGEAAEEETGAAARRSIGQTARTSSLFSFLSHTATLCTAAASQSDNEYGRLVRPRRPLQSSTVKSRRHVGPFSILQAGFGLGRVGWAGSHLLSTLAATSTITDSSTHHLPRFPPRRSRHGEARPLPPSLPPDQAPPLRRHCPRRRGTLGLGAGNRSPR